MATLTTPNIELTPRGIRLRQATFYSGITRQKLHALIKEKKIKSYKVDGVRLVDFQSLKNLLDGAVS